MTVMRETIHKAEFAKEDFVMSLKLILRTQNCKKSTGMVMVSNLPIQNQTSKRLVQIGWIWLRSQFMTMADELLFHIHWCVTLKRQNANSLLLTNLWCRWRARFKLIEVGESTLTNFEFLTYAFWKVFQEQSCVLNVWSTVNYERDF